MTGYRAGFDTLETEVAAPLALHGEVPGWLAGTLVRNGPAVFDHGGRSLRHWFDGQAMLHRFAIGDGSVRYTNRLLDTPSLRSLRERGRIGYGEFATDPCGSLFGRFFSRFNRRPSANACVNVTSVGGEPTAVSEVPLAVAFDPETLETLGVTDYSAGVGGAITTAHPHALPDGGDFVNYVLSFGRRSEYRFYRRRPSEVAGAVIGRYAMDKPGYVHSFAVTRRHIVLAVFPLVVNPLSFLLRGRPFIENYAWRPQEGTRIVVLDAAGGGVVAEHTTPAVFAFHHVNAFDDGDTIVMDLCAFDDAAIVPALYLGALRDGGPVPTARATRYTVPLGPGDVSVRRLADEPFELPRIHYTAHNGRPYRYAYGVGATDPAGTNFLDQLVKLDVHTGRTMVWRVDGGYPGEPVFVPAPAAAAEDDGVVLSVVLDAERGVSSLVVLDGATFTEMARADVPHAIPFGFHGQFTRQEH